MKEAVQSEGVPPAARARPVEKRAGEEVIVSVWLLGVERLSVTVHEYLMDEEGRSNRGSQDVEGGARRTWREGGGTLCWGRGEGQCSRGNRAKESYR